ncbi:MAG: hypothetical protein LAT83_18155 [Kiritimatiellae bacterium]|nr:hypothetical protein [Kiritimatiellia bacterium]
MKKFVVRKNWKIGIVVLVGCLFMIYQFSNVDAGLPEFFFMLFCTFGFLCIFINFYYDEMFALTEDSFLIKKKYRIYYSDISDISIHETFGKGEGIYKTINVFIKLKNSLDSNKIIDAKGSWISVSKDRKEIFLSLSAPDTSAKTIKKKIEGLKLGSGNEAKRGRGSAHTF